ncbi:MAG: 3-hydroxyacyl-CoA dehydrogenase family protein [Sporolactobacillus sp.]
MIKKVAVIGSGVMGCGIAQSFAAEGYQVAVNDIKQEFLDRAKATISRQIDLMRQEGMGIDKQATMRQLQLTTDLSEAVRDADWVIEAIPEVIELKWQLYKRLKALLKPSAIVSSNTSTFPLSVLTQEEDFGGHFLITHFFNPAHLIPLVEIVKNTSTSATAVQEVVDLLERSGKKPIVLKKEINGFIANRLQSALMREAFALVAQGVAEPEDIDRAVTEGIGFRWAFVGPTRIADFGGLDTWKRVLDNIAPDLDKSSGAPELMNQQVAAHALGAKSGGGLYNYDGNEVERRTTARDVAFVRLAQLKREQNLQDA